MAAWPEIVSALEQAKGRSWAEFADCHGDWGRDGALWLGRRVGRLSLAEVGKLAGGLDYAVVSKAIARFSRRLVADVALREQLALLQSHLSNMTRPDPSALPGEINMRYIRQARPKARALEARERERISARLTQAVGGSPVLRTLGARVRASRGPVLS